MILSDTKKIFFNQGNSTFLDLKVFFHHTKMCIVAFKTIEFENNLISRPAARITTTTEQYLLAVKNTEIFLKALC